jgi:hypothetical protein
MTEAPPLPFVAPEVAVEVGSKRKADDAELQVAEAEGEVEAPAAKHVKATPQTLGFKTFDAGEDLFLYFANLLKKVTPNQRFNEVRIPNPLPIDREHAACAFVARHPVAPTRVLDARTRRGGVRTRVAAAAPASPPPPNATPRSDSSQAWFTAMRGSRRGGGATIGSWRLRAVAACVEPEPTGASQPTAAAAAAVKTSASGQPAAPHSQIQSPAQYLQRSPASAEVGLGLRAARARRRWHVGTRWVEV